VCFSDMTQLYVWHDSFDIRVTWLILMHNSLYICICLHINVYICMYKHIYTYIYIALLHSSSSVFIGHDLFTRVTQLIHMGCMTHSYVQHDSCVTWLIHMCDTTDLYVWHNSFICVLTWLIRRICSAAPQLEQCACAYAFEWPVHMCDTMLRFAICKILCAAQQISCDMTYPYVWLDSSICVTWLICRIRCAA